MHRILSHGGGVQTTVEALMHARGDLPPIDAAIFADTLDEPRAVYRQLDWLITEISHGRYPFPIYRVSRGNLWKSATTVRTTRDGQRKYIQTALPVYLRNPDGTEGRGMRACSRDFKISMVNAKARELIGRRGRHIREEEDILVTMMIGYTVDEVYRVKPNPVPWIRNTYPLLEAGMSRADCYAWAERNGYPEFVGSACKKCPHRTNWGALEPDELQEAIDGELALQAAYAQTEMKGIPYLHESRIPLSQVRHSVDRRRKMAEEQMNMFINQCEGGCGI